MWPWRSPWHLRSMARSMYIPRTCHVSTRLFALYTPWYFLDFDLSFDSSIHNSANSWPRHFKFSTIVVEKGTFGFGGIMSSIYLNWNIFVIYCQVEIKLVLVKAEWQWLLFRKTHFCYVTSGLVDMASLKFPLRISFLNYLELSHNLVKEIWVVHMTLTLYKISCEIEGHLWGQLQGKCIFFLDRLICPFITPPIFDRVTSSFQLSSLKKGTSSFEGITSSIYLNWNISAIYSRMQIELVLVKAEWQWLSFLKKNIFLSHFRSRRHDVIKVSVADIFSI